MSQNKFVIVISIFSLSYLGFSPAESAPVHSYQIQSNKDENDQDNWKPVQSSEDDTTWDLNGDPGIEKMERKDTQTEQFLQQQIQSRRADDRPIPVKDPTKDTSGDQDFSDLNPR